MDPPRNAVSRHAARAQTSGIPTLDALIGPGGLPYGLTFLVGSPIAGKTALAMQVFLNTSDSAGSAIYCQYNLSANSLSDLAARTFEQYGQLRATPAQWGSERRKPYRFYFGDEHTPGLKQIQFSLPGMRRELDERAGAPFRLIVFDTLTQGHSILLDDRGRLDATRVAQIDAWAKAEKVSLVGTVDVQRTPNEGARPISHEWLDRHLKEPIMASSGAYILHLDRDKLLEFKKREPARLQYMPASFNPPDPLGIDLILDHDRAWFFDANSERNKVMRQALGAPTQRLGRPVWDEMS